MTRHPDIEIRDIWAMQGPMIACECGHLVPLTDQLLLAHFMEGPRSACEKCDESINLWEAALRILRAAEHHPLTLSLIGAITWNIAFKMRPGEFAEVDLHKHGLPDGARLLRRRYSHAPGFRPVEIGHEYQPHTGAPSSSFTLFAYPDEERSSEHDHFLGTYWFVPREHEVAPLAALTEPFTRLAHGDNELVALLLQAAVEEAVRLVIESYVGASVAPNKAARFARNMRVMDGLRVLVPTIASSFHLPGVNETVLAHVDSLRDTRNRRAHSGRSSRAVAAENAAAALFAVVGLHYIHATQIGQLSVTPNPN